MPGARIIETAGAGAPHVTSLYALTSGPRHHFFGYYGVSPWDVTGTYMLCLECTFGDRLPEAEDSAAVCVKTMPAGEVQPLSRTYAWNLQQGAMMYWLDPARPASFTFNQRIDERLGSTVVDLATGATRSIGHPVAALAPDGRTAASLSYGRLRFLRPVVGYAGVQDAGPGDALPDDDGIFIVDLESGAARLILSIRDVFEALKPPASYTGQPMWLNHVVFNRTRDRIFFLSRYNGGKGLVNAAWTVGLDGKDLHCLLDYRWRTSHFDWIDSNRLVLTSCIIDETPWRHFVLHDGETEGRPIAPDRLSHDGHCAVSPDSQWMVTDSYPIGDERMQHLFLVHLPSEEVWGLAALHEPETYKRDWRCDLHPRWSRDGHSLCVDSTHTGARQVYQLDLAGLS